MGQIKDEEEIILVDGKVAHNFIALCIVEKLELPVTNTTNYGWLSKLAWRCREKG